jgi:hypothetical protein
MRPSRTSIISSCSCSLVRHARSEARRRWRENGKFEQIPCASEEGWRADLILLCHRMLCRPSCTLASLWAGTVLVVISDVSILNI